MSSLFPSPSAPPPPPPHSQHSGEYIGKVLTLSYRWRTKDDPDPDGEQLAVVRKYVREHPEIKYVFIDFPCLPQGERDGKDKIAFFTQLPNMYLLYLGTSVLVCIVNREYMERFWTQLEAWYSFRKGTEQGLVSTPKEQLRCTIVCVHEEDAMFEDDIPNRWANCSVERACELLAKPWVRVYDPSDKVVQLKELRHLEFHVRRFFVKKAAASSAGGGARPQTAPARMAAGSAAASASGDEESITSFLARLKLEKYEQTMRNEDVNTVGTLRNLSAEDLKELGLGLGARKDIAAALKGTA